MWQHIDMVKYISENCFPNNVQEEIALIEWVLDLMYWDLMKLLYHDQYPYALEIMKILDKWNISSNYVNLVQSTHNKYVAVRNIADSFNDPKKLLEFVMLQDSSLTKSISDTESKLLFRIGRRFVD